MINNIDGTRVVADIAHECGASNFVLVSTDKAVHPTSVMGCTKQLAERYCLVMDQISDTKFAVTRFGNVLGSRGSVATVFERQIKAGGPVTLTDPEMTRFVMTLKQACSLVLEASELARGGEVFVTKMPVMRIEDLAHVMIYRLAPEFGHAPTDIEVTTIGSKAGEKFYEELMTDEETRRTWELPNMFTVLPAFRSVYQEIEYDYPTILRRQVTEPYHSATGDMMTYAEIEELLELCSVLQGIEDEDADIRPFVKRAA